MKMVKATLTGKYDKDISAALSISSNVGDASLQASVTKTLVLNAAKQTPPSFSISLEKPNSFSVDYSLKKDAGPHDLPNVKFKFTNSIKLVEKTMTLTYSHAAQEKKTEVEGSVSFNTQNNMAVSYVLGTKDRKLKYKYTHGQRRQIVVEPSYDLGTNALGLAVSRKFEGGDAVKASYQTAANTLGLDWSRDSKTNGIFKISASLGMVDRKIQPKFMVESTWTCDI